jgi:hypothetical protein
MGADERHLLCDIPSAEPRRTPNAERRLSRRTARNDRDSCDISRDVRTSHLRPEAPDPDWRLDRLAPDPTEYRRLYRAVGEDWLWFSRLLLTDAELAAIIGAADLEVYRLTNDGDGAGLLELDFREKDECELAFFGLSRTLIGGPADDG